MKKAIITVSILLCSFFIFLWVYGFIGLWSDGIGYIINGKEMYTTQDMSVSGDYTVEIDLTNLESNKNKVVYDDGECKILIQSVDYTGSANSGGYRVHFRSIGDYSINGAKLVSGISYQYSDNGISSSLISKMRVLVKDSIYDCNQYGWGGEKDGNNFSFYLFPSNLYESGIDGIETVAITMSNLNKNIWTRQ